MERMRRCPRCKEEQPLTSFRPESKRPDGVHPYCRTCAPKNRRESYLRRREAHNAYARTYQKERPEMRLEANRRYTRRVLYGVTPEDFERMLAAQEGRCRICREPPEPGKTLHVDHVHDETARVRGLLCNNCNGGIALLRHDEALLRAAIDYLRET